MEMDTATDKVEARAKRDRKKKWEGGAPGLGCTDGERELGRRLDEFTELFKLIKVWKEPVSPRAQTS